MIVRGADGMHFGEKGEGRGGLGEIRNRVLGGLDRPLRGRLEMYFKTKESRNCSNVAKLGKYDGAGRTTFILKRKLNSEAKGEIDVGRGG